MNTRVLLCLIFGTFCMGGVFGGKFPSNRPRCHAGDMNCLKTVMNQYIRQGKNGLPDLNLPPLDPLFVPEINIIQSGRSSVNIKLNFKNANFVGLSNTQVMRVTGFEKDPIKSNYEFYGRIPRLTIVGDYNLNGRIILLPVVGNGPANMTFDNIDVTIKGDPTVEIKQGKEYLQFKKLHVDFTTTRLSLHFQNLFNGNEPLARSANQFFNDNWLTILNELKPELRSTMANILKKPINTVFATFPYTDCFL